MNNAELIKAIRENEECNNCAIWMHGECNERKMSIAAADALEADEKHINELTTKCNQLQAAVDNYEKRIAELEAQLPKEGEWIDEQRGMKEILQSVPSAWIKCSDRLPYDDQMVLVSIINKEIPFTEILICRYIKCERPMFRHYGFRGIKDFTDVTHWMPLPDAPEVDE